MVRVQKLLNTGMILALVAATVVMFVPVLFRFAETRHMHDEVHELPETDVALVLGASVRAGVPSPILEERAHAAIQLYLAGKVDKILVTGDDSVRSNDEVTPVRKYLQSAGIPDEDIFLDHAGFDTYSSMYRARAIFDVSSATIVTQDFHLPRAVYIARALGIEAVGLNARGGGTASDYVREIPASFKAIFDVLIDRQPKFLGEKFPITGDGSPTWY